MLQRLVVVVLACVGLGGCHDQGIVDLEPGIVRNIEVDGMLLVGSVLRLRLVGGPPADDLQWDVSGPVGSGSIEVSTRGTFRPETSGEHTITAKSRSFESSATVEVEPVTDVFDPTAVYIRASRLSNSVGIVPTVPRALTSSVTLGVHHGLRGGAITREGRYVYPREGDRDRFLHEYHGDLFGRDPSIPFDEALRAQSRTWRDNDPQLFRRGPSRDDGVLRTTLDGGFVYRNRGRGLLRYSEIEWDSVAEFLILHATAGWAIGSDWDSMELEMVQFDAPENRHTLPLGVRDVLAIRAKEDSFLLAYKDERERAVLASVSLDGSMEILGEYVDHPVLRTTGGGGALDGDNALYILFDAFSGVFRAELNGEGKMVVSELGNAFLWNLVTGP